MEMTDERHHELVDGAATVGLWGATPRGCVHAIDWIGNPSDAEGLSTGRPLLIWPAALADSMEPSLRRGDPVFVDASDSPAIAAWHNGFGETLNRLELVPNISPPLVRISSDNTRYLRACMRSRSAS